MIVKLLTEHHLEFLSIKGGRRGSSESTLVKKPNCWKSHVAAHIIYMLIMSRDIRFPTMRYVRPAKSQISMRIPLC